MKSRPFSALAVLLHGGAKRNDSTSTKPWSLEARAIPAVGLSLQLAHEVFATVAKTPGRAPDCVGNSDGKSPDEIDRFLALQSVPEAMPVAVRVKVASDAATAARSENNEESPTRHDGGMVAGTATPRTVERLRAVNRAPESVRDAFKAGRISLDVAAKLGPSDPTPETAALIAAIAGEVKTLPDRKQVDAVVRALRFFPIQETTANKRDSP